MANKKILIHLELVLLLSLSCSCIIGPVHGIAGTYTVFAGEIQPSNDVAFEVEAEGCQHGFLGLFAYGSASAGKVAKNNNISRIAIVDHSTLNLWSGVYARYCTIVVGERGVNSPDGENK